MILAMKFYDWNEQKNQEIKQERGVSFEEVVLALDSKKNTGHNQSSQPESLSWPKHFYRQHRSLRIPGVFC